MNLACEEHKHYKEATTCWICEEAGFDNNNKEVCINQKPYCALNKGYQRSEYIEDFEVYKKQQSCTSCQYEIIQTSFQIQTNSKRLEIETNTAISETDASVS